MTNRDPSAAKGIGTITPMKIVAVEGSSSPMAEADTDPAAPPPKVGTDPGVAPPAGVYRRESARPQNVRVPASGANDSVEELLGTMIETPKPPSRTAPDSSGQAAVTYHAQHALHRGQVTPVPEPKVIVERSAQQATMRIDRSKLPLSQPPPPPKRQERTVEIPRAQGPRVLIALFAAVLVVFGIFVALKLWSVKQKQIAVATDPTASALVEPPATASVGAAAAATAPVAATASAEPAASPAPPPPPPPATDTAPATASAVSSALPSATAAVPVTALPLATAPIASVPRPVTSVQRPVPTAPALPPDLNPYAPSPPPKTDVKRNLN